MEHSKSEIPSFEQLPAYVAGLKDMLISVNEKLDALSASPKDESDKRTVMTIKEASDFLGKTVGTLYTLTSAGAIPFSKRGNKLYFFKDELIAWIKSGGKADIDFRNDANREVYEQHLDSLQANKRRKPSNKN